MNCRLNTTRRAAAALIVCVAAGVSSADLIVLNDRASTAGETVKLGDIATLHGDAAEELAGVEIATATGGDQVVQMIDVRRKLDEAGVHWGKITLRGATRIVVSGRDLGGDTPQERRDSKSDQRTHIAANLVGAIDLGSTTAPVEPVTPTESIDEQPIHAPSGPARTLRRILVEMILDRIAAHPSDVRLTFDRESDVVLDLTDADFRFEIEPVGSRPIGRVPIIVRRYNAGQIAGTERIRVDVAVRKAVVVAQRTLGRGQMVAASDVAVEVRWLDSMTGDPVSSVDAVVGQRVAGMIRQGRTIGAEDVTAPVMIKRGQVATIRVISGTLVLKTVARALDDASRGDSIRFRNDRTREEFIARVTGPQQATVQINQGGSK